MNIKKQKSFNRYINNIHYLNGIYISIYLPKNHKHLLRYRHLRHKSFCHRKQAHAYIFLEVLIHFCLNKYILAPKHLSSYQIDGYHKYIHIQWYHQQYKDKDHDIPEPVHRIKYYKIKNKYI